MLMHLGSRSEYSVCERAREGLVEGNANLRNLGRMCWVKSVSGCLVCCEQVTKKSRSPGEVEQDIVW